MLPVAKDSHRSDLVYDFSPAFPTLRFLSDTPILSSRMPPTSLPHPSDLTPADTAKYTLTPLSTGEMHGWQEAKAGEMHGGRRRRAAKVQGSRKAAKVQGGERQEYSKAAVIQASYTSIHTSRTPLRVHLPLPVRHCSVMVLRLLVRRCHGDKTRLWALRG